MPVRNAERFVTQAVQSILHQTLKEFELIIIDDGSTDNTPQLLEQIHSKHIRVYTQKKSGISDALNQGLSLANGKYIARMDADDVSLPGRLQKQVEVMESQPEIGLVGSVVVVIDDAGKTWGIQPLESTDVGIRWTSLLKSPFVHPTVMVRKACLDNHGLKYGSLPYAEDYGLWIQLLRYTKGINIGEPLVLYRVHRSNVSILHRRVQFQSHYAISRDAIRWELPQFHIDEKRMAKLLSLVLASSKEIAAMGQDRREAIRSYLMLWQAFEKKYEHEMDRKYIHNSVISRAVSWTLLPPLSFGFQETLSLINQMDQWWYFHFLAALPGNVGKLARERLVWRR
jgi:glycosyltransferase involved in cell wall biosynthesis